MAQDNNTVVRLLNMAKHLSKHLFTSAEIEFSQILPLELQTSKNPLISLRRIGQISFNLLVRGTGHAELVFLQNRVFVFDISIIFPADPAKGGKKLTRVFGFETKETLTRKESEKVEEGGRRKKAEMS